MPTVKVSEDLRPLSELKAHAADVVRQVQETGRPVVLTRHGRGVAVVLSLEVFEELQQAARRLELQRAVDDAERDLKAGHRESNGAIEAKLNRWARGQT